MATVDGETVNPDKYGNIQGNGGDVDKMAGGSGKDILQGQAEFNQYYGGAGNDTFKFTAKFGQTTAEASGDFTKLAAYVTDFHGASTSTGEQDFISLTGFGEGSKVTLVGEARDSGTVGGAAKLYQYTVLDTHTGEYFNFLVNSLNGNALGAGDFAFYGSTPGTFTS